MIRVPRNRFFRRRACLSNRYRMVGSIFLVSFVAVFLLGGCASDQVSDCQNIAGAGWRVLTHPPENAARLLSMDGVESDHSVVWLGKGRGRVLACHYEPSMTSPGCSESRAYEFLRTDNSWRSNGVLLSPCDASQ